MIVRHRGKRTAFRTVTYDPRRNIIRMIDQRRLPHEFRLREYRTFTATARAIREMVVRGAGAIAAAAAFGYAQGLRAFRGSDRTNFDRHATKVFEALRSARPTAVDPVNAIQSLRRQVKNLDSVREIVASTAALARQFADDNVAECREIGKYGAPLIREGSRILTHCNAGWLAFVDFGSATAPLYQAQIEGRSFHVFCDETRPRCQGSSLTAWELAQQGISHEVIADNAAGFLMQRGEIDLVIVGSDRTLGRTGEVANKIGTYSKAVLARRHDIPFYVAIPCSTLDWDLQTGNDIPIEERAQTEVLGGWGKKNSDRQSAYFQIANPTSQARNPGFDVTPPELITGIITPAGIFPPKHLWKHRRRLGFSTA